MRIQAKANSFDLKETKAPIIHGETEIVLKNVKTGLVERIYSENVFQGAQIAKYLRSHGIAGTILTDYTWQNIVGGIFLFRNGIEDGKQFMPAGNRMVGNGAYGVTNNGEPAEMGSYNSVESSASGSAITQVYDFTTSQANGTIGCVCLTSATGGYIGYGNPSGVAHATKRSYTATQSTNNLGGYFAFYDNIAYGFSYARPILTVTKKRKPVTRGSVFNQMETTQTIDLSELSGYFSNFALSYSRAGVSEGKVYFFPIGTWSAGTNLTYLVFDLATETAEFRTVMNSTGNGISVSDVSVSHGMMSVSQDSSSDPSYIIDLQTSVLVRQQIGSFGIVDFTDELAEASGIIYDPVNDTAYPTNGERPNRANSRYEPNIDALLVHNWYYSTFESEQINNHPHYLATINNLQTPVTKTAAQTMKVTYTLTEV